jgi:hypothetical protein
MLFSKCIGLGFHTFITPQGSPAGRRVLGYETLATNQLTVRSSAPVCQGIPLKPALVLFQVLWTLQKYFFIGSDFKIAILKSPRYLFFFKIFDGIKIGKMMILCP